VGAGVAEASAVSVASVGAGDLGASVDPNHVSVSMPRARLTPQEPLQGRSFNLCLGSKVYLTTGLLKGEVCRAFSTGSRRSPSHKA
jgi:hypothetical protein